MDPSILLQGRPYGGVALLWKARISNSVTAVNIDSKRACGVKLTLANKQTVLILSLHLPTDNRSTTQVDNDFEECVNAVEQCIEQQSCDLLIIGGDLNVDLQRHTANLDYTYVGP